MRMFHGMAVAISAMLSLVDCTNPSSGGTDSATGSATTSATQTTSAQSASSAAVSANASSGTGASSSGGRASSAAAASTGAAMGSSNGMASGGMPGTPAVVRNGLFFGFPERFNRYYTDPTWQPTRTVYVSPNGTGNGMTAMTPTTIGMVTPSPGLMIRFLAGTYDN